MNEEEVTIDPQAYIEILQAELAQEATKRRMYQALYLQQRKQESVEEKTDG